MKQQTLTDQQELFESLDLSQKMAEEILAVLEEENKAIRKMDVQALTRITKQKENLLIKIHYLDNRLSEIIKGFSTEKSRDIKKLKDLAPFLSADKAATLLQFCRNLAKSRQEIHTNNYINKRLTSDTLLCINDAIALITAQPAQNKLYGNKKGGAARYTRNAPTMISREV